MRLDRLMTELEIEPSFKYVLPGGSSKVQVDKVQGQLKPLHCDTCALGYVVAIRHLEIRIRIGESRRVPGLIDAAYGMHQEVAHRRCDHGGSRGTGRLPARQYTRQELQHADEAVRLAPTSEAPVLQSWRARPIGSSTSQ